MSSVWPPDVGLNTICTSLQGSFWCARDFQEVLIFANKPTFRERARQTESPTLSSQRTRVTVSSTGHHARQATGFTGQRGRKALPGPNWWRGGRERGGQRTRLGEALPFVFFLTGARCSNQAVNKYIKGDGDFFSFSQFRFHFFFCFWGAVPCCAFSFVHIKRSMHVHACGVRVGHGALGICKSPVYTECFGPSVPFFSSSGTSVSPEIASLREAPCTAWFYSSSTAVTGYYRCLLPTAHDGTLQWQQDYLSCLGTLLFVAVSDCFATAAC